MNCGCTTTCGCGTAPAASIPICRLSRVAYIKAFNEDGCEVALTGNGLLLSEDSSVYYTDGSVTRGQIPLNPENTNGVKSILGISDGVNPKIFSIGEKALEGSTLVYTGGLWTVRPLSLFKNSFDVNSLKLGNKIAALTCSNSGVVELAYLTVTPSTYLYINAEGNYEPRTQAQLTENLLLGLCAAVPNKTEDEVITSIYGCTAGGKTVKGPTVSSSNYLTQMMMVYSQNKHNGAIGVIHPQIIYFPAQGPLTVGAFVANFVNVDLETIPGYTDRCHSVVILLRLTIANHETAGVNDVVGLIGGVEYIRLTQYESHVVKKATNEVKIQIPPGASKVIRLEAVRQFAVGGPFPVEHVTLEMFIKCFEF